MTARVYKIVNNVNDDIYIGSTRQSLAKRLSDHKRDSKRSLSSVLLYSLVAEIDWDCFRIVLIEEFECDSRNKQIQVEQKYIDELKPSLNKNAAYGTKCEHEKTRGICKECHGSQICEHNRQRTRCKECGGGHICEHNRIRSICKECGGSQICEHDRRRTRCKECHGGHICEHNKQRSFCKECGGGHICQHKKAKSRCIDCNVFICQTCDKKYCSKYNLKRHIKTFHPEH